MMTSHRIKIVLALTALVITVLTLNLAAQDMPPDPDGNKELFKHSVDQDGFMNPPICARPGAF